MVRILASKYAYFAGKEKGLAADLKDLYLSAEHRDALVGIL